MRMVKAGTSNRENLIKNLNIILERTAVPENTDLPAAHEFYMNTKSILNTCLKNAARSQQYVKVLFPEAFRDVLLSLKQLDSLLEELILPINNLEDQRIAFETLPEEIEIIRQTAKKIAEIKTNIHELEHKAQSLKDSLAEAEAGLIETEASEAFIRAQELEMQLEKVEAQIDGVEFRIKEMFAPLSKALSRVEKQDESGRFTLSSEQRAVLKMLIQDQVSALNADINPFLSGIRSRVEDGSLGIKEQKMNRTLEHIDELMDTDTLSGLKSQRDSYSSQRAILLEELNRLTVYQEKTKQEKEIADCEASINSIETALDNERNSLEILSEELEVQKENLNSRLAHLFERDIEVKYNN